MKARRCVSLDVVGPLLPRGVRVVLYLTRGRPRACDDILGGGTLDHDLVGEAAALSQHEDVELAGQVVVLDDGRVLRIGRLESHAAAVLCAKSSVTVVKANCPAWGGTNGCLGRRFVIK